MNVTTYIRGRFSHLGMAALLLAFVATGCVHSRPVSTMSLDSRINHYQSRVRRFPNLYPAHTALAIAYLDKARQTHDAVWVQRARAAAAESLAIQPNLSGFQAMAAISNFSHRFEEAVEWSNKAAQTAPGDTSVMATLVESNIALGRVQEAERFCAQAAGSTDDFYRLVANARVAVAKREVDQASQTYIRAANVAGRQAANDFSAWALVMAAGVLIDAGRPAEARPLLDRAGKIDSSNFMLALHRAELDEAEGQWSEALRLYARLADRNGDPAVHARAFEVARKLGREESARRHFAAAERGYQKVLDAGEVYTLAALARLYLEADVHLDRALELSRRCLEHQRDTLTQQTFESVQRKLQSKPSP